MNNLAIIPARGGSKRIPRKNVKDFLGKPIIAYSIEAAFESELFDEVMVSTDDEEIAEMAKEYGAQLPFMRSAENADDFATTVDVLLEVIQVYKRNDKAFENICCLYPTAPFVKARDLKQGYNLLGNADSSLPVVEFDFPVQRAFRKDEEQNIRYAWPENETTRSQDLEPHFHDAGQWYWIKTSKLLKEKSLITSRCKYIEKSRMRVQDIDTLEDWKLAEMKYKLIKD
jgi:N-acylneuraminate cytidylyltransferase